LFQSHQEKLGRARGSFNYEKWLARTQQKVPNLQVKYALNPLFFSLSSPNKSLTETVLLEFYRGLHSQYSARDWLSGAFVYTAMVNYPTAANFMAPLPGYPVEQVRYSFVKVCHRVFSFSRPSFSLASDVQDHRRLPSRIQ